MPKTAQSDGGERTDPDAEAWRTLCAARRDAHVPAPRDGLARVSEPRAFRVRVSGAKRFVFGTECGAVAARGNALGARVTCSFYDESTGRFFGTTTSGGVAPVANTAALSEKKKATDENDDEGSPRVDECAVGDVDCSLDAFFVTDVADKRRLAVFEIVLVETHPSTGLVLRETAGGWAATPVDAGEGFREASEGDGEGLKEKEKAVPVRRGSVRYLAWGAPRTGKHPPEALGECALSVTAERCPASAAFISRFVEKDALVFSDAAVPGVAGTLARREEEARVPFICAARASRYPARWRACWRRRSGTTGRPRRRSG